jgi:arylsulfatase A-like enzyme
VPRETHEPYIFEGDADYTHQAFVTSEIVQYIRTHDRNRPFFAIAGYYAPHPPINPLKQYVDKVDFSKITPPVLGEDEAWSPLLKDVPAEKWIETKAYYLALVAELDDLVGEVVSALKEQDLYDDTVIVFTSDHGEFLGDHGRIQKGMPGHDCITHVPFLIKYAREIKPGTVIDNLVEGVDFVPTILDFCGIQIPRFVQGKSLRPLLRGETTEHKDSVLVESFEPYGLRQTTLRTAKYKYYCSNAGDELFFDLEKDPGELENRVNDPAYKEAVSEMRYKLVIRLQNSAFRNMEMSAEY